MHVLRLRLENWLRYEGEHDLSFGPSVFGIVAKHSGDEGRSNWLGKTSILRAIRFALFGVSGASTEDEWLTYGKQSGAVELELSNGMKIRRSRKRGKSTQVEVMFDGLQSNGADAQRVIVSTIGLDDKDFLATSYFEQKAISRYISAQPAERMKTIAGWLNLEALQRAEKYVSGELSLLEKREAKALGIVHAMEARANEILSEYFEDVSEANHEEAFSELESVASELREIANAKKAFAEKLDSERGTLDEWRRAFDAANHREGLIQEANEIESAIDRETFEALEARLASFREALDSIAGDLRAASDDCKAKAALAKGEFDGVCPIDGHACPDVSKMNAERKRNVKAAEAAEVKLATIRGRKAQIDEQADVAASEYHKVSKLLAQAKKLRDAAEADSLRVAAARIERDGPPPESEETSERLAAARKESYSAESEATGAERSLSELRRVYENREEALAELSEIARLIATHKEALAIFGRNGAQRRIAEGALAVIDAGANAMLARAGIDLKVEQTWRQPTKGLGDNCEKCGASFPSSAKVKVCEKCGEPRPPKYIERPEVKLSNVSGAAEDVAGVAIQLAAAAWLREQRGTQWACVCIDEPFGSLDSTHRRALAVHLSTMIKGQGFEQAFIVSHNRDVNDALPSLVQVTGEGGFSTVKVLS